MTVDAAPLKATGSAAQSSRTLWKFVAPVAIGIDCGGPHWGMSSALPGCVDLRGGRHDSDSLNDIHHADLRLLELNVCRQSG